MELARILLNGLGSLQLRANTNNRKYLLIWNFHIQYSEQFSGERSEKVYSPPEVQMQLKRGARMDRQFLSLGRYSDNNK